MPEANFKASLNAPASHGPRGAVPSVVLEPVHPQPGLPEHGIMIVLREGASVEEAKKLAATGKDGACGPLGVAGGGQGDRMAEV
jgi:hypothetical protein